jgi:pimeloyl-ACP methyl ester carboxylesterase
MKKAKQVVPKFLIRTRVAKDIVCEVAMPARQTGKVAIVCPGAPAAPVRREVLDFLAAQGYVAFGMRYRGTWESGGIFLKNSPAKDVTDIIDYLAKEQSIIDAWTEQKVPVRFRYADLFGGSFGGPAVLLNSQHKKVRKVVALAPVVDWSKAGEDERFEDFVRFSKEGFGGVYRPAKHSDWQKFLQNDFYNPITMQGKIDPERCFIVQALDDTVCPADNIRNLVAECKIAVYYKPKGGHLGTRSIVQKFFWNKIADFLE